MSNFVEFLIETFERFRKFKKINGKRDFKLRLFELQFKHYYDRYLAVTGPNLQHLKNANCMSIVTDNDRWSGTAEEQIVNENELILIGKTIEKFSTLSNQQFQLLREIKKVENKARPDYYGQLVTLESRLF